MLRLKSIFTLRLLLFYASHVHRVHHKMRVAFERWKRNFSSFYTLISKANEDSFGDLCVSREQWKLWSFKINKIDLLTTPTVKKFSSTRVIWTKLCSKPLILDRNLIRIEKLRWIFLWSFYLTWLPMPFPCGFQWKSSCEFNDRSHTVFLRIKLLFFVIKFDINAVGRSHEFRTFCSCLPKEVKVSGLSNFNCMRISFGNQHGMRVHRNRDLWVATSAMLVRVWKFVFGDQLTSCTVLIFASFDAFT